MGYTEESLVSELSQEGLENRCIFITGGNSGFGYTAARILLKAKAEVIIGCRSLEHAETACEKLKQESGSDRISYLLVDLTDPDSIRNCVEEIRSKQLHIQVLVNNAGVSMVHTYIEAKTGIELTCQTNYIGVVELTDRLIPLLLQEENPRCVFVSSYTYAKNPVKRVKSGVYYGEANDLMTEKDDHPHVNQESVSNETKESAGDETQQNPPHTTTPTATVQIDPNRLWVRRDEYKRFASYFRSKYIVTSYALYLSRHQPSLKTVICDPGVAATNIARELGFIGKLYALPFFQLFAPTAKGACTIAFAAGSGKVAAMESGVMLKNCRRKELIRQIRDVKEQEAIRKVTMDVIQ